VPESPHHTHETKAASTMGGQSGRNTLSVNTSTSEARGRAMSVVTCGEYTEPRVHQKKLRTADTLHTSVASDVRNFGSDELREARASKRVERVRE